MIHDNLDSIADYIQQKMEEHKNIIFLLQGPLGIGKTTLIKKVLNNINENIMVTSPTYSIMHQYDSYIFHYDLYMKGLEHALSIGILDLLSTDGVHFVEWGSEELFSMLKQANFHTYVIKIKDNGNKSRFYELIEG